MGKCPNCGRSGWTHKTYECVVCEKEFCDDCSSKTVIYGNSKKSTKIHVKDWEKGVIWEDLTKWEEVRYAHSPECEAQFVENFRIALQNNLSLSADSVKHFVDAWFQSLPKESRERVREIGFLFSWKMNRKIKDLRDEARISYLERAGRYEEAVSNCDYLAEYHHSEQKRPQFLDKARKMREKSRAIKMTQTVVDLNRLLEQIKDGGIVVSYRCPHCGGKLKVGKDTSVESLKVCEYCGSEIEAMELADFLRTALS